MDPLDSLRAETARYGYGLRVGCTLDDREPDHFVEREKGLLAIGPPRSGKTSSLVVPNLLGACGPVVTTSTKPDVLLTTGPARARVGRCLLFDPGGTTAAAPGVERVAWSPLDASGDFAAARLVAQTMVQTARPPGTQGESQHWNERAQALLAIVFHAAALDGMTMHKVLSLVDQRESDEVRTVLARHNTDVPLDALDGIRKTEAREQSGIWSTASSILAAYRSERALDSSIGTAIDFDAFVRSEDTLYICSPADEQQQAAPIVAGLLRDVRTAAYEAAAAGELGAANRRPPLLLLLDEVANIAPLHDLPALVSQGGSQGVVTLACLQDLSQAVERWGPIGEGYLGMFNTKVIFPGVGDARTLGAISSLAGERDVTMVSTSEGDRLPGLAGMLGRRSPARRTYSTRREPVLPVDRIAQGQPGHVVCLDGALPSIVEARPWFQIARLSRVVEESRGPFRERGSFQRKSPRPPRSRPSGRDAGASWG